MAKNGSGVPKFGAKKSSTTPMSRVPKAPRMSARGKGRGNVRLGR